MTTYIPEGLRTLTTSLTVSGAERAIEFYKAAFGAELTYVIKGPSGFIPHAELKIGDSIFMINDEFPNSATRSPQSLGGTVGGIVIYVPDVDASFKRAVEAGAQGTMPPTDTFWGDRHCQVIDPFGHVWGLATRKEHLSQEEVQRRSDTMFKQYSAGEAT